MLSKPSDALGKPSEIVFQPSDTLGELAENVSKLSAVTGNFAAVASELSHVLAKLSAIVSKLSANRFELLAVVFDFSAVVSQFSDTLGKRSDDICQLSGVLGELSADLRQLAADLRQLAGVVSKPSDDVTELAAAFSSRNPGVSRIVASRDVRKGGAFVLCGLFAKLAPDRRPLVAARYLRSGRRPPQRDDWTKVLLTLGRANLDREEFGGARRQRLTTLRQRSALLPMIFKTRFSAQTDSS